MRILLSASCLAIIVVGSLCLNRTLTRMKAAEEYALATKPLFNLWNSYDSDEVKESTMHDLQFNGFGPNTPELTWMSDEIAALIRAEINSNKATCTSTATITTGGVVITTPPFTVIPTACVAIH